jgi:hypothetical protein
MSPKLIRASLIVGVSTLVVAGCGGDDESGTTRTTPVSSGQSPSYSSAKRACGAAPVEALARSVGLSTADPATIAKKYAQRNAPVALRRDVEEGCLDGLTD